MKTQVAIIGAGPAGLFLGHMLHQAGIDCLIIERQSAAHVASRIRAGILEATTTDLMARIGLDARLKAEGLRHDGLTLVNKGHVMTIPVFAHTGKHVTAYGQTEITRDLIDAADDRGLGIVWEAEEVALHDVDGNAPSVTWSRDGQSHMLSCRYIAGCDGFHGPSRRSIPGSVGKSYQFDYPFGWLGVLADAPPCHDEVAYAHHDDGFALASMRSPTRSRYYVQVALDDHVDNWPDDRFYTVLTKRIGPDIAARLTLAPAIEKSIAPLRSFVSEPMRYGSLFLAGDAAHIVPPTGAKGLNLAASDVTYLGDALIDALTRRITTGIDGYSQRALARVWKTERFSWYMTKLLHRFPDDSDFERRMQDADLDYVSRSDAAQAMIAENYVGLPL